MTQEHFIFAVATRKAFAYVALDIQPVEPDAPELGSWIVARNIVNLQGEEKEVYKAFHSFPSTDIENRLNVFKNSLLFCEIDEEGFKNLQQLDTTYNGYGN